MIQNEDKSESISKKETESIQMKARQWKRATSTRQRLPVSEGAKNTALKGKRIGILFLWHKHKTIANYLRRAIFRQLVTSLASP